MQFFSHEEGRVRRAGNDLVYETFLKDHLGNTRVMFADLDENGWVDPAAGGGEVVQIDHYYPFGMRMSGTSPALATAAVPNAYTYNGNELQNELGLGLIDFNARFYDPALGRFVNVDPLANLAPGWTPFRYGFNNPLKFADPTGLYEGKAGSWSSGAQDSRTCWTIGGLGKITRKGRKRTMKRHLMR